MKILVTGASGFVGRAVVRRLLDDGLMVRAAVRRPVADFPRGVEQVIVGDLDAATDWTAAVSGVDVIVHAAARVHVMRDVARDPLAEFRRVNVQGTENLARTAAGAGVSRLIFISSIKVNGESTRPDRPFTASDDPAPVDPYGVSKLEAERALRKVEAETSLEVVIIRPVLVYGPGVKGNFRTLLQTVSKGLPLPLGAVRNRRSLVALDNLVDLVVTCVNHPAAAGRTFLVSDDRDLSTSDLIRIVGDAVGRRARLFSIPPAALRLAAAVTGKSMAADRLLGSLQVDIEQTRRVLGWRPPASVEDAVRRAARAFLDDDRSSPAA